MVLSYHSFVRISIRLQTYLKGYTMKKLTMLIAAVAMTTLFAQANDVEKMEATVDQIMQDAKSMAPAPEKDVTPETKDDKNNTQEEAPSEEAK